MLRNILASITGIVIAIAIVFLADKLSHMLYPLPAGLDTSNIEDLRDHIAGLPIGAFLAVMSGWVVATFVGGVIANLIGTAKTWINPTIVGGFVFTATVATLIAIPHPHWFTAVSLVAILASAWLAWRFSATN